MFNSHKEKTHKRKKGLGITGIFRLLISLIMIGILGIGVYQAYRSFSGIDPLKIDPKSIANQLLESDDLYGLVTGLLSFDPKKVITGSSEAPGGKGLDITNGTKPETESNSPVLFKFAIVADSHNDNTNLAKALERANSQEAKFVIGLGDFSEIGTLKELEDAKAEFDRSGVTFYVIPGDHDLWDSRDKTPDPLNNFRQVFGNSYQSFSYQNTRFTLIYNTDIYQGLDGLQFKWIDDELTAGSTDNIKLKLVFAGTPLFHPSSDHVMGRLTLKLKNQAEHLTSIFSKNGVKEVFAGDAHFYSEYKEPKTELRMRVIGAVTSNRNAQAPRYAIVEVKVDGSYKVVDMEIK